MEGLVDSGATKSMIREKEWKQIMRNHTKGKILRQGYRLMSITGHVIRTMGIAQLQACGKELPFYVVGDMPHAFLMGDDILRILGAQVLYKENKIVLAGEDHTMLTHKGRFGGMQSVVSEIEYWKNKFPSVFPEPGDPINTTDQIEMEIDTGDATPINCRPYRVPLNKRKSVEEELHKLLEQGVIEPSNSPWAAPLVVVPKPDGTTRLCVDYRKLNAVTKKDAYPMPLISEILDSFAGAKHFTTLDLRSGYYQIPMHPNSIEKTAVNTHIGLFQFLRMSMGMVNSPAIFQRFMNKVLSKFKEFCLVYIDDLIIFSQTEQQHHDHIEQILWALQENGLSVKQSKCVFGAEQVKLLGFIVTKEGLTSDPEKVKALRDMNTPTNVKDIRRLLGSTNYYRTLIPRYAEIVRPLVHLTKKKVKFEWTGECEQALGGLKEALIKKVVLAYPQTDKPYKLYTDASQYSFGAVLMQDDERGIQRPVHLVSRQFNDAQKRYSVIEKEGYALVFALKYFKPYLTGAECTIVTDHKPLKSLFKGTIKSARVERWALLVNSCPFEISYIKGADNVFADLMSRLLPSQVDQSMDDGPVEPLSAVGEIADFPWELDGLDKDEVKQAQKLMPEYEQGRLELDDYVLEGGHLFSLGTPRGQECYPRLVLPEKYRKQVIDRAHISVGHMAFKKTHARIFETYVWPGLYRDVYKVLNRCGICLRHQAKRHYPPPTAMPIAEDMGDIVAVDLTGPFPVSKDGNRYIISLIDHATGFVEAAAIPNKTAECVYKFLQRDYVSRYGPPKVIIMDNGKEFDNKLVREYLKGMGVEIRHTTPYHPQSNGRCERSHRSLKSGLSKLSNCRAAEWEEHLPDVLLAHRTAHSDTSGFSPFYLLYGRLPSERYSKLLYRTVGMKKENIASRIDELALALKQAANNTLNSRKYNTDRRQQKTRGGVVEVGDAVLVRVEEPGPFDPRWDMGYLVTRVSGPVITCVGPNNTIKKVNRDRVVKVDNDADWADLRTRQTRTQRINQQKENQIRENQRRLERNPVGHQVEQEVEIEPAEQEVEVEQVEQVEPEVEVQVEPMVGPEEEEEMPQAQPQTPPRRVERSKKRARSPPRPVHVMRTRAQVQARNRGMDAGRPSESENSKSKRRCVEYVQAFCGVTHVRPGDQERGPRTKEMEFDIPSLEKCREGRIRSFEAFVASQIKSVHIGNKREKYV